MFDRAVSRIIVPGRVVQLSEPRPQSKWTMALADSFIILSCLSFGPLSHSPYYTRSRLHRVEIEVGGAIRANARGTSVSLARQSFWAKHLAESIVA
jgi:hypothetical protein